AEGLFDPARKKKLPYLPGVIGVVTSPTGAVIRDILHRLADRFPRHVLVWPVRVQGEGAAAEIAAAIAGFNALAPGGAVPRPDLLIVARGGGSLEDLMPFNEEIVVRAAAASAIPLIAAVGHETDTTLIDFAADHRAPTPTAAAERAVPVRDELLAQVLDDGRRLLAGMGRLLAERRTRLDGLARGLGDPDRMLAEKTQRLDDRAERLVLAGRTLVERRAERLARAGSALRHPREIVALAGRDLDNLARRLAVAQRQRLKDVEARLSAAGTLLESYSFQRTLERGFALVTAPDGRLLPRAAAIEAETALRLRFADGTVDAVAGAGAAKPPTPKPKPKAPAGPTTQGTLL
ncbi:MAG: exodeoxyribonuclease VII large subunit, partial [Alphaproteobacteria bacterium]|nr:exodeoxyribonuclease VII large subunit [Alphaproteobacteria bacterium]